MTTIGPDGGGKRTTILDLGEAKRKGRQPLTMLTAYDSCFARMVDQAGVDIVLVGDSLGMVVQGRVATLPVQHVLDDALRRAPVSASR